MYRGWGNPQQNIQREGGNGSRYPNLCVQILGKGAWFCVVRINISRKLPREEEAPREDFPHKVHIILHAAMKFLAVGIFFLL